MTKFAVAILLALTMPASAEDMNSANYFLPGCKGTLDPASTPTWNQGLCAGFVAGVLYAAPNLCLPQGLTNNQAVAVVTKYIEARPERMHEPFGDLALEALTAAWPCKRAKFDGGG
jgi:hypothetical protein